MCVNKLKTKSRPWVYWEYTPSKPIVNPKQAQFFKKQTPSRPRAETEANPGSGLVGTVNKYAIRGIFYQTIRKLKYCDIIFRILGNLMTWIKVHLIVQISFLISYLSNCVILIIARSITSWVVKRYKHERRLFTSTVKNS